MTLCFGALIKVLRICSKPKVYNKTLCGAVIKTLDVYYGEIVGSDDSLVSHLVNCGQNLSPDDVIIPMRTASLPAISKGMSQYVIPLLNEEMIPQAILALQEMALSTVSDNGKIGSMSKAELAYKVVFNPADFFCRHFPFYCHRN